jgi:hypothetical protein
MAYRLSSHTLVPPGQFYYVQIFEKNGRLYQKRWQSTPEIGALAAKIAAFRKANQLLRASPSEALEDIDAFTCARLNNNPKWVMQSDMPWTDIVTARHGPGCATCGNKGT